MSDPEPSEVLTTGRPIDQREERLATGADSIAGRTSIVGHRHFLVVVASATMTAGLCAIVLAWVGASHSTLIEEQLPYLISGGLLGLALAIIGGLTFFTHWLTVLVREARAHEAARARDHAELLEALRPLGRPRPREEDGNGDARGTGRQRPVRRTSTPSVTSASRWRRARSPG